MNATPANTAVVTLYNYSDWIPETAEFFYRSALRLGYEVVTFKHGHHIDNYTEKVVGLRDDVASLDAKYEYVLYVDCRDAVFLKPLADVCATFNALGWPILFSAKNHCAPHIDPGWASRFGRSGSGYDFLNAGVFMAERSALTAALHRLDGIKQLILDDRVDSAVGFLTYSDQFVWQAAYVERALPIGLDHYGRLVHNFSSKSFYLGGKPEEYGDGLDLPRCRAPHPVTLRNGSTPAIVHFPGAISHMIPYFYTLLELDLLHCNLKAEPGA
jgi:hypothetical protein